VQNTSFKFTLSKPAHELVVAAQQLAFAAYAPINVKLAWEAEEDLVFATVPG
jgi:hypothetical protein